MDKKYLLIYERNFMGYASDTDYEGNAQFSYSKRSLFGKYTQTSLNRLKALLTKDIATRRYKSEGFFYTLLTKEELMENWNVDVETVFNN